MAEVIADGFGSEWERCARKDCDLQVVRPGMVQCIGDSDSIGCPDILDEYVAGLRDEVERLRALITEWDAAREALRVATGHWGEGDWDGTYDRWAAAEAALTEEARREQ